MIAGKVTAYNLGLSDHSGDEIVLVPDTDDSGMRSTISVEAGRPTRLHLRDAATQLGPIIAAARARRRQAVAKIDCEGSEFAIVDSLGRAGLLTRIDAVIVEWHAMFPGKSASTLTAPLLAAGYSVVDLSPPQGNGFFYAFGSGRRPRSATRRRVGRLLGRGGARSSGRAADDFARLDGRRLSGGPHTSAISGASSAFMPMTL